MADKKEELVIKFPKIEVSKPTLTEIRKEA